LDKPIKLLIMKNFLFSAIACVALAGSTYAASKEVKTADTKEFKKMSLVLCTGKFTVTDLKGNVVFTKTIETSDTGLDCIKVMGAAHSMYEQYWGVGYKVSSIVNNY
jgi:hypothetical protein